MANILFESVDRIQKVNTAGEKKWNFSQSLDEFPQNVLHTRLSRKSFSYPEFAVRYILYFRQRKLCCHLFNSSQSQSEVRSEQTAKIYDNSKKVTCCTWTGLFYYISINTSHYCLKLAFCMVSLQKFHATQSVPVVIFQGQN